MYYTVGDAEKSEPDCNTDRLWEIVDDIHRVHPDRAIYQIVGRIKAAKKGKKIICPTSIIDPELDQVLLMENMCELYKCLPYGGGLADQPKIMMDAFATVRSTINQYDEWEAQQAADKSKAARNGK